jgi:hypothetical protein
VEVVALGDGLVGAFTRALTVNVALVRTAVITPVSGLGYFAGRAVAANADVPFSDNAKPLFAQADHLRPQTVSPSCCDRLPWVPNA